jgi:hypothetical protein
MESLNIGCTPIEEPCAQVGQDDYARQAKLGCKALIGMFERLYPCPEGAQAYLYTKSNSHDFGTYYEVEVKFDEEDPAACDWAYLLEAILPERWDAQALDFLAQNGYRHFAD